MSRTGYSLVELLIVLAILAALAALVQPSMRGVLDKSRLTAGAKQVQAAIAKSRALAIREGVPVWFRFEPGGQRWWIERDPAALPLTDSPEPDPAADAAGAALPAAVVLRSDQLPEGVMFEAPNPETPDRLRFSPAGRTTSRSLRLTGQRQFAIDLTIRGLTGMASSSSPRRVVTTEANPLTEMPTSVTRPMLQVQP